MGPLGSLGVFILQMFSEFLGGGLIPCIILELLAAPPGCWCSQRHPPPPAPVSREGLVCSQHPVAVWCRGSSALASGQPVCLPCFSVLALSGLAPARLPPQLSVHSGVTLFPACCIPSGSWKSRSCQSIRKTFVTFITSPDQQIQKLWGRAEPPVCL